MNNCRPQVWPEKRLRFLATINPVPPSRQALPDEAEVSFLPMEAIGEDGALRLDVCRQVGDVRAGYSYFADGDVAFAKVTPCFENGKGALMRGLASGQGFGTTELTILRPGPALDARFLHYFLQSTRFRQSGAGAMTGAGGLKRVPEEFTRNTRIPLPALRVQQSVADYLDRETARIDVLNKTKTRFIELLREKRQALITQAVDGWQRRPLKYATLFLTSGPRGWSDAIDDDGEALFVQSGDLTDQMALAYQQSARIDVEASAEAQRTRLRAGDVVVCITGANTGRVALAEEPPCPAFVNQHLCLIRPNPTILDPAFLALVLHSRIGRDHFEQRQYGLKEGLSLSDIGDTPIPLPSLVQQGRIVTDSRRRASTIDRLSAAVDRSVQFLKERRAALITAAVTGQIDVRTEIPEEQPEAA